MTEWLDEPGKDEFKHDGFKCLIIRHSDLGHLCGYVAVPRGHPCYGKKYDHIPYDDLFPVRVHGGLTFSREGDGDTWQAGYWWLGFDCAHAWDVVPYMPFPLPGTYKNFQYVRRETKDLADQVVTLDFIDWEFKWVWPLLLPLRTARRIWSKSRKASLENGLFMEHRRGESGIRVRGAFIPFLKKGQTLDVIICTPKGGNPLEEHGVIVPGSQTGQCDRCGQDIWIAPSTQELMKDYPDVPTRCLDCVRKQLEEKEDVL